MNITLLIVDDEPKITSSAKYDLLEIDPELNVICTNSALDALQLIREGGIDVLLTDIAMPEMDGYALYTTAKEYRPNLIIIMMTGFGYDPNHVVVRTKKIGLENVIFKPFNAEKLLALIRKELKTE